MTQAVFPPALKHGGTIGILAPARWPEPKWIEDCTAFLQKRGYKTVVHSQNYLKDGQLAGNDAARAGAIKDMFADAKIDAILCARGGANSIRIVDKLDYQLIKKNPKPFIGFSDISLLLNAITKQCGFVTYHGPMVWNFAHEHDPRTANDLFKVLGDERAVTLQAPETECIRAGTAEGILAGGNLTRLELLMGTDYDWSTKNGILFFEDVDEVLYKLDEKLHHLRLAGRFKDVRAVIVGEMINIGDGETGFARQGEKNFGRDLRQIFMENLPSDIPLCFNFPCGHGKYLTTLPLGAEVQLKIEPEGATLSFSR